MLLYRARNRIHPEILDTQFGFLPDRDTRNAIYTLSALIERLIEMQKDLFLSFIDCSKAFDKVKHEQLFKILENLGKDGKDLRILRNLYWEQEAAIRSGGEIGTFKAIKRGVRQGCVLSPDLFNIYSEIILRNIEDHNGIRGGGRNINNLRYADDTVLIADSEQGLQNILNVVTTCSEEYGLSLNTKKTECMVVSKKSDPPQCNISCKNEKIKEVHHFKYLGFTIKSDGKCDTEIRKRIAMSKETFTQMRSLFNNRNLALKTKTRMLKAYVWSLLLYGCECWTLNKTLTSKLEATEMWYLRRILRISWTEKVTNEDVLRRTNTERSLVSTIRKRQLKFLGHITRKKINRTPDAKW